jgi:hypothetical protein
MARLSAEKCAATESVVQTTLRRQGITNTKVKKLRFKTGGKITDKDITLFTRQLATMMKSGVPLLQSFDIVGRGHANPAVGKLLLDIKADVETGSSYRRPSANSRCISTPCSATWSPPANRPAFSIRCLTVWPPTRKRSLPSRARSNPHCSTQSR